MKKKRRLIWQIYPSHLMIILISVVLVAWYATDSLRRFYLRQTAQDLQSRAYLLHEQISSLLSPLDSDVIDAICKEIGQLSVTRITVILPGGQVIGDSKETPRFMDNHGQRPEVLEALTGGVGQSVRFSKTLQHRMMYVAVPLMKNNQVQAVIRAAVSVSTLDNALRWIQLKIALGGLVIALLAAGVSLYVSRRISMGIERMRLGAEHFSKGDLSHRLPHPDSEEMASLAEALNRMAAQLSDRMQAVIRQRKELEAVLSSMLEGVVAVDRSEHIISMNNAAGRMFACDPLRIQGRNIQEVIRNLAIQRFVAETLSGSEPIEDDFVLYQDGERVLNIHSAPLQDADGEQIGSLLVLNDVTRLRHLENVRSDFVANVSHEIKTPLTAIKGFVETLQHGGVDDKDERERFLGIIIKHVDRLNAILEDLLALSRIEQEKGDAQARQRIGAIGDVIQTAVQVCQPNANARHIAIDIRCDRALTAKLDATLLEQALVNLIDNAVKYSHDNSSVTIEAGRQGDEILIHIHDEGAGIPYKHLPRLFERFYRVDKARSRNLGGTGLGLAIVKHIVQAHGGHVSVESTLGKGSTFTIHLPVVQPSG
jgi:two-component system phosphate regulon sensor histidine kinase PhoR